MDMYLQIEGLSDREKNMIRTILKTVGFDFTEGQSALDLFYQQEAEARLSMYEESENIELPSEDRPKMLKELYETYMEDEQIIDGDYLDNLARSVVETFYVTDKADL
jgi:hypothetical protein